MRMPSPAMHRLFLRGSLVGRTPPSRPRGHPGPPGRPCQVVKGLIVRGCPQGSAPQLIQNRALASFATTTPDFLDFHIPEGYQGRMPLAGLNFPAFAIFAIAHRSKRGMLWVIVPRYREAR